MIRVLINGKSLEIEAPLSVAEYLDLKGLAGRSIAVAVNGTVLRKDEFGSTTLTDGDRVEIVRPVGGGS